MSNLLNPPGIYFINKNLSAGVLAQIVQQFYISEVMSAEEFDHRIDGYHDGYMDENDYLGDGYISDGYYSEHQKGLGRRILVLRDLRDYTNRAEADLVLCYRNGLICVEDSKIGPVAKSLPLQHAYLWSLIVG